ncbi:LPS-assembly protein LptD [Candidatus Tisiphia endosymbiont of Nemotelus uliginosus]|uniref:LPS-assembly protein LptD n=1 Tax=Candidatus Tisiphia endosymbiont of Nemotelus uliginosus TaxID=3077926 RepID=UPI0035C92245
MPPQFLQKQFNFISTDYVEYIKNEQMIYAKGNVQLIIGDYFLSSDRLFYDIAQDKLWAEGNVMIKDKQNKTILGETVILKEQFKTGVISDFILYFGDNTILVSKLAERVDENILQLSDSTFTPCKILCNRKPIWQVSARNTEVDLDNNKMVYKHLFFEVWGVPIFYTPYFSHPTPKAKAKSGILVPKIRNNALSVPLYYRAMPNLDFTLTPRIFQKYNIFELEGRYKPNASDYMTLESSYGKVPYKLIKEGKIIKNRKIHSGYMLSNGTFNKGHYSYGFKIERVSDKAYLKNYYKNYTSYLTSKIYLHNINHYNYFVMEAINFEGLNVGDSGDTDPLIFPKVRTKNVINLNEQETSKLILENDSLIYKEKSGKELGRTAIKFSIDNHFITAKGHLLRFIMQNRTDIYIINHLYPNDTRAGKVLSRNIPEIHAIWRYPLASLISNNSTIMIEPIMSVTIGRKHNSNKKFSFIDNTKYELSENNIFCPNHYSGIDNHEFGHRLSYGINSAISSGLNHYTLFLGQAYSTNFASNPAEHIENVGKISSNFADTIDLFYRFRKSNTLKPIRDEVGTSIVLNKFQFTSSFAQISNLKKYYLINTVEYNKLRQLYYSVSYQLTDNWLLSYNMRLDCPKTKRRILSKSIKVTYLNDCVRIAAQLSDDYMVDSKRGIKKSFSLPTIAIGLKILNM